MPMYRVIWEIDLDATTPEHAASLAREIQTDPFNTATHFSVYDGNGEVSEIDIKEGK